MNGTRPEEGIDIRIDPTMKEGEWRLEKRRPEIDVEGFINDVLTNEADNAGIVNQMLLLISRVRAETERMERDRAKPLIECLLFFSKANTMGPSAININAIRALKAYDNGKSIQREADVATAAGDVMRLLEEYGASIVPHLMDNDENAGQRLREALAAYSPPTNKEKQEECQHYSDGKPIFPSRHGNCTEEKQRGGRK